MGSISAWPPTPAGSPSCMRSEGHRPTRAAPGKAVQAYNVATETWTSKSAQVGVYYSNGVAKIGNRLYFSGGYVTAGNLPDATRALWAYDYAHDRLIRQADLPIFSAEGVSGAINGELYVLPGSCNGNGWPNPGFCEVEQTRRFYRYDPTTNTWTSRRQSPHLHRRGAATVLDGKLYDPVLLEDEHLRSRRAPDTAAAQPLDPAPLGPVEVEQPLRSDRVHVVARAAPDIHQRWRQRIH